MKNILPEYFQPTDEEIKEVWQKAPIVLDANVLLNLFRYSKNSREELIKILNHYKDRIWVPYQVAFEFLENCRRVPANLNKVLTDMLRNIDSISGLIEGKLELNKFDKYHLLKPEELRREIKKFQERIRDKVEKIKREYDSVDKDSIIEQIAKLLEGKVGEDFEKNVIEELFKEGEKRYKEEIPPGYKDLEDKKGEPKRHLYGDLIWWKQTIEYSRQNHCDLIIVTDDAKEDWWYKVENKTKSPRVELIKEFRTETNQKFHVYRTGRFMEFAKKYDKVSISDTSIKEVKSNSSIDYSRLVGRFGSSICWQLGDDSVPDFPKLFNPLYGAYKPKLLSSQRPSSSVLSAMMNDTDHQRMSDYFNPDYTKENVFSPSSLSVEEYIKEMINREKK